MNATADAPPVVEIEEAKTPIGDIVAKMHAYPAGQVIRYQPAKVHQRNLDLFVIELKQIFSVAKGKFTLIPTPNGVLITKM